MTDTVERMIKMKNAIIVAMAIAVILITIMSGVSVVKMWYDLLTGAIGFTALGERAVKIVLLMALRYVIQKTTMFLR